MKPVVKHFYLCNSNYPDEERAEVYRSLEWEVGHIPLKDVGVWNRAQGFPHEWCIGNILDTARCYLEAEKPHHKIKKLAELPADVVLDTIIVVDGDTGRGREDCERTRWNIDDGCMRAITKAVKGYTTIRAYMGTRCARLYKMNITQVAKCKRKV